MVIGDVCGTGPAAAALTALARHSIRSSAWHDDTPVEVLTALNHAVRESETGSFLTAVFATLEKQGRGGRLDVVCGGHPPPIVVSGSTATSIGIHGTLLGVTSDVRFQTDTTDLAPGDVVVFYTDGATDVSPPHGLTPDDVIEIVRAAAGAPGAKDIIDEIHNALDAVLAFNERDDDVAMLVLRITDDGRP